MGERQIKVATPEKALLDVLYLSPVRSRVFHQLPEVELPKKFSLKRALNDIEKINSKSRRTIVSQALDLIIERSKT